MKTKTNGNRTISLPLRAALLETLKSERDGTISVLSGSRNENQTGIKSKNNQEKWFGFR